MTKSGPTKNRAKDSVKIQRGRARSKRAERNASSPVNTSARYLFFGGKGGVGKTTAACAAAIYLLDQAQSDEQILIFSTDPAHSLSDSLGIKIGDTLVEVECNKKARLLAREMNPSAALAKFKEAHGSAISMIAERGTLLDANDIDQLLNLSLPGLDEVMALFELSEIERQSVYTRIIVDTAPSGHTSRLLQLPRVFTNWVKALDRMSDKHRYMVAQLMGRAHEDEADIFLRDMTERIERVRAMLYDASQSAFTLVTLAEGVVVEETLRYFNALTRDGVPVTDLLINRVEQDRAKCDYCHNRVAAQKVWIRQITQSFNKVNLHKVPLFAEEVRGLDKLRLFAHLAWAVESATDASKETVIQSLKVSSLKTSVGNDFDLQPRRLLIFGGKGGVGKTTAAAATALALAEKDKRARVLVCSTDPAHSLSDSFDEKIGELKRQVAGMKNLDASEVDAFARFEAMRDRYREWIDELFEALTAGSRWEIQFDREAMREIVSLAPPGMDEIAALGAIIDLLDEGNYTAIVLDTAPTGHLVRFLELPEVALDWVRAFMKLLLKYKSVTDWGSIAEELVAMSKNIKRLVAILTDPRECEFIGVAIPEQMSLQETVRLTETLDQLKIHVSRLLINNVVPDKAASSCSFCSTRRHAQEVIIGKFHRQFKKRLNMFIAPQQPNEVRGADRLRAHFSDWHSVTE